MFGENFKSVVRKMAELLLKVQSETHTNYIIVRLQVCKYRVLRIPIYLYLCFEKRVLCSIIKGWNPGTWFLGKFVKEIRKIWAIKNYSKKKREGIIAEYPRDEKQRKNKSSRNKWKTEGRRRGKYIPTAISAFQSSPTSKSSKQTPLL